MDLRLNFARCLICSLILYCFFCESHLTNSSIQERFRRYSQIDIEIASQGTQQLLPGRTIYGSVIVSDINYFYHMSDSKIFVDSTLKYDNEFGEISYKRAELAHNLSQELPFPIVWWPSIVTKPCPNNLRGHKTERGVALAHFQIWWDFSFFDHDVLLEAQKGINGSYSSTTWSSTSGKFTAFENGTLLKNGIEYRDDDIMVIFEDDAEVAIHDVQKTLTEELGDMTTDLLFLGWCEGRLARPVPLCAHAYAITRRGAKKLIHYFEPCGLAVDEQFVKLCKNNWITYRKAHHWSYKNNLKPNFPRPGDKTHGIFRQRKVGSLNGH